MKYKFSVHIRKSKNKQFFSALVSTNGQDVYVQETRKRKATVVKQVNTWFPGVKIVDQTIVKPLKIVIHSK